MASQLSLEILIKTVLDAKGVQAAQGEIKQLAATIEAGTSAGKAFETSADGIVDALKQQRTAAKDTASEFKGFTDEQKAQAREALRNIEANERTAASAKNLGRDVRSATGAFSGFRNVIGGALNGNLLQMAQGMGQISNAAAGASKAMQGLFAQVARGGAIGAVFAGPVLVALAAMKKIAAENEAAMQRMWATAAAGAEAYAARLAEATARIVASAAEQTAAIERVIAANDRLAASTEKTDRRQAALFAAQKERALAQATTPEERAEVEARFGGIERENRGLDADRDEKHARDNLARLEAEARAVSAGLDEARARAERSRETAAGYGASTTPEANRARKQALADRDALVAAEREADANYTRLAGAQQSEQDKLFNIDTTRQVLRISGQRGPARSAAAPADTGDRRAQLRGEAQAAFDRGDHAAQDYAVAELRRLNAEAAKLSKTLGDSAKSTGAAFESATRETEKLNRKLGASKFSGNGG